MKPVSAADPYQVSFQHAFQTELFEIIDSLSLPPGAIAIDVPCGDGFYTERLADRLPPGGRLIAVDGSEKLLETVRNRVFGKPVEVQKADAYKLPFDDSSFDLVWCAQSLISLEPAKAVAELHRICKPEGLVAILEVDQFHHILLPWPAALEVALNTAVYEASVAKYGDGVKLAPARRLRRLLIEAGFDSVERKTCPIMKAAPFDDLTRDFLQHHVEYLKSFVYPFLDSEMQRLFDERTCDTDDRSVLRSPHAELECMNIVYHARKAYQRSKR